MKCIGATTLDEYRKHVEKDAAFERRFQPVYVKEPSVEDTISILRGLKQRYETHHGVIIRDSALVIAAQLADRYISSRFQPDKSIDLVDEACASLRVQLDSQPEEIDKLERRKLQLEIEATALQKEKERDEQSEQRLKTVNEELSKVRDALLPLKARYEKERGRVNELREAKRKMEELTAKMDSAKRRQDLALVADLQYGAIPDLKKKIERLEQEQKRKKEDQEQSLLPETVGPDQIAEIVGRFVFFLPILYFM